MLVFLGRLFPNLANHYAALGAWETQLTDEPVSPERPANLFHPVDEGSDRGAHGSFDDEAGGFTDPSFLGSLPVTMLTFFRAVAATGVEKAGYATALPEALRPRRAASAAAFQGHAQRGLANHQTRNACRREDETTCALLLDEGSRPMVVNLSDVALCGAAPRWASGSSLSPLLLA